MKDDTVYFTCPYCGATAVGELAAANHHEYIAGPAHYSASRWECNNDRCGGSGDSIVD